MYCVTASSSKTTLRWAIKSLLLMKSLKPPINYLAETVSESNLRDCTGVFVRSGKRGFKDRGDYTKRPL